jgi:hypothetical protein
MLIEWTLLLLNVLKRFSIHFCNKHFHDADFVYLVNSTSVDACLKKYVDSFGMKNSEWALEYATHDLFLCSNCA